MADTRTSESKPPEAGAAATPAAEIATTATVAPSDGSGKPKPPTDDPEPNAVLADISENVAKAEALKPIQSAIQDLYSPEPAKEAARLSVEASYRKVAGVNPEGELRTQYMKVDERFVAAATDLLKVHGSQPSRLQQWIDKWLKPEKNSIKALLLDRDQVRIRLAKLYGERESKRDKTLAKAKRWQQAYADWAAPQDKIKAILGEYAAAIDKLNADINNDVDADLAIYTFWFDVAPKHLQLRWDTVDATNTPGVDLLRDELAGFDTELHALKSGKDRRDGSVYLIEADAVGALTQKRIRILEAWRTAAEDQAVAEARFKLRPDDAASLKARRDAFAQSRAAAAAALLKPKST